MDAYLNGLDALPPGFVGDTDTPGGGYAPGIAAVVVGNEHRSRDKDSYTPVPGVLPTMAHLEYVQRFSTAGLLVVGFLGLIALGIVNPGRAVNLLARGARKQAGVS